MIWLILGIVLFLGIHSLRMVAPRWRDDFLARRGEGAWKGLYSIISVVGLILLIWGYGQARMSAIVIYQPPFWIAHLSALLMWISLVILMASQLPAGRMKQLLKHPMVTAVIIWALAHLAANGDLASVLLFGSFLIWGVWNRIAVSRRPAPVFAKVSILWDIAAGIIGSALFVWFVAQLHEYLFGIAPLVI